MSHVELSGDQIVTLVKARDILDERGQIEAREAVLKVLRSAVLITTKNPIFEDLGGDETLARGPGA